jgi:hypothetical protein
MKDGMTLCLKVSEKRNSATRQDDNLKRGSITESRDICNEEHSKVFSLYTKYDLKLLKVLKS